MIHVRHTAEHPTLVFEVVVREGKGETRHHVTMSQEVRERLTVEAVMAHVLHELLLYCCLAAFVTGIVLAAATLIS
jgi:hypothetical protein